MGSKASFFIEGRSLCSIGLEPERFLGKKSDIMNFIGELSKWESSMNNDMIQKARGEIFSSHDGSKPRILDPFSGGGSIPLESLRLGCETFASDLNPVAVLLEKAILEYPQRYSVQNFEQSLMKAESIDGIFSEVKKWGSWVEKELIGELKVYYPNDQDGAIPVGYFWANTVHCINPSCRSEIPLVHQTWLANVENKKIAYRLLAEGKTGFKVEVAKNNQIDFDPSKGTVARAKAVCIRKSCGSTTNSKEVREQFRNHKSFQRLVVVATESPRKSGKGYRPVTSTDKMAFDSAKKALSEKITELKGEWGISPIPDEPTPKGSGPGAERAFSIYSYGMTSWGIFFNDRQKLALLSIACLIKRAYQKMIEEGYEKEYAKVISTYLALTLDRTATYNTVNGPWVSQRETPAQIFGRQTIQIVWDYVETNPLAPSFGWRTQLNWVLKCLQNLSKISMPPAHVSQCSATDLPYNDDSFDAIFTDPPYYDNVPYSYLSDFFYVWLKRTIGNLYPELFATPLTPKSLEIVAYGDNDGGWEAGKHYFESMLAKSFKEMNRVLKPEGIAVIVFAHKTTEAWETIIRSLLSSGLYLTASWPINSEREGRLRSHSSAALASSIYMVCRKRIANESAYYNDVKTEIDRNIKRKLVYFWEHGIRGSDFFVSAIGPAIEVFGRYEHVEKLSGEVVTVAELLEYVQKVVSEFALERILKRADLGGVDNPSRFYLLWRWVFNNSRVKFDDARKLSQAIGVELEDLWNGSFVLKDKEFVTVP